jgi:hypothetical protein
MNERVGAADAGQVRRLPFAAGAWCADSVLYLTIKSCRSNCESCFVSS